MVKLNFLPKYAPPCPLQLGCNLSSGTDTFQIAFKPLGEIGYGHRVGTLYPPTFLARAKLGVRAEMKHLVLAASSPQSQSSENIPTTLI